MPTSEINTTRSPEPKMAGSRTEQLPSWTFDPRRTEVGFIGRRMGTPWVNGRFTNVRGKFYLDTDDPVTSSCVGEIDVDRLYAGEPYLNTQLRSADFLGIGEHRTITFTAHLADGGGDADFKAEVLLTIRGFTQRVMMDVVYLGEWEAPVCREAKKIGMATRMGLRAAGVITPDDFRVQAPSSRPNGRVLPANALRISIDVEAMLDADLKGIAQAR